MSLTAHLASITENLTRAYVSYQLHRRLTKQKDIAVSVPVVRSSLNFALLDQIVICVARIWDSGATHQDSLSIPNLIGQNDFEMDGDLQRKISAMRKGVFVRSIREVRTERVAHSLVNPYETMIVRDFGQTDFVDHLNECFSIVSEISEKELGFRHSVQSIDVELERWDKALSGLAD